MIRIGVVTGSRADYTHLKPLLDCMARDPQVKLALFVTGTHLAPEFGRTVQIIEKDGFKIQERVENLLASDTPEGIAKSMGLGLMGFAQAYAKYPPDILVVLGDRFEVFAACGAAIPYKIPIAHINGGESTEGAIDEVFRHAITKMSSLHFASMPFYAKRIIQMGEEPWRVSVSGALSLDHLNQARVLTEEEIESRFGISIKKPFLLATYHPVTQEYETTETQLREVFAALEAIGYPVVFTYPNADTAARRIIELLRKFQRRFLKAQVVCNLGTEGYFSLMTRARAMVGNSSSGIIEAPSFKLPVVNIGLRQKGRVRAANVIDAPCERRAIVCAIKEAMSPEFLKKLKLLKNPYGNGRATQKIVAKIKKELGNKKLLIKSFHDLEKTLA